MKKIRITGLVSMVLSALLLVACAAPAQEVPELLEPVGAQQNIVEVRRGDIYDMESYTFAVIPKVEEVPYPADGTLDEICVVIGQQVKAGDVLLRLDVESIREQLEALDADIAYTLEDNALTLRMLELDVAICESTMGEYRDYAYGTKKEQEKIDEHERVKEALKQEQERQELQMQQMYAERKLLNERIENSELIAPCDGQVAYIAQKTGDSARAGSTAIALSVEELLLRGEYISESEIKTAAEVVAVVGDTAYAVEYLPMDPEEYISMMLSGAEMNTDFAFADGVPEDIEVGAYALILVKKSLREQVLYLPPNALENDAAGWYVYRADGSGGRERVEVEIGTRVSTAVEIAEGLKEGDEVYVP